MNSVPPSHEPIGEKEKADEALARYTWWLTAFTGMLAFATIGLGIATAGLYLTGEKQIRENRRNARRQFILTRRSIEVADRSAKAAEHAMTNLERPWLFLEGVTISRRETSGHFPARNVRTDHTK